MIISYTQNRMRWVGHVVRIVEMRNAHNSLVLKPDENSRDI
jgi:hypothetical protein